MHLMTHTCLETFRNAYIVASEETRCAIIIDPTSIDTRLINLIEQNGFELHAVLLTSPRSLHERPVRTLRKIYPVQLFSMDTQYSEIPATEIKPGQLIQPLDIAVTAISVASHGMHTVVYRIGECIFTGDVLGAGRIGEPTSSFAMALLKAEIQEKLLSLPVNTLVFPAHGSPSTIEAEIRTNPYLQEQHDPFHPES